MSVWPYSMPAFPAEHLLEVSAMAGPRPFDALGLLRVRYAASRGRRRSAPACGAAPPEATRRGPVAGRSCGAGCAGGGAPSGRSTLSREPAVGQTTHLTVRGDRRVALDRATRDVLKFAVAREGAHSPPRSSPAQARQAAEDKE